MTTQAVREPPGAAAPPALELAGVSREFPTPGGGRRVALRGVDLRVAAGRTVSIVGRSGSGKSTLLHLAAGIDVPTSGRVAIVGRDLGALGERERTLVRRDRVGIVFQFFHLLAHLTVAENVALPGLIAGARAPALAPRVGELLGRVGLADRAGDPVAKLSGGEMQRVAICRALLNRPALLVADEPTGNLDDATGREVMELMLELGARERTALVYVTHSRELAALGDERFRLHDGLLEPA